MPLTLRVQAALQVSWGGAWGCMGAWVRMEMHSCVGVHDAAQGFIGRPCIGGCLPCVRQPC